MDPLPMLTLACELNNLRVLRPTVPVTIELGQPRRGHGNRFLRYAAEQGFLHIIAPHAQFRWKERNYCEELDSLCADIIALDVVLAYQTADCIKAKLFDFRNLDKTHIPQTVEALVTEAQTFRIERWLLADARQREYILQSMRGLLTETLDNIAEHAYVSGGFGALYARIRSGSPEDADEFSQWREVRLSESRHCPILRRNNFGKRPGWLELFVCDVGQGLLTHLPLLRPSEKSPLLSRGNQLFREALSRHRDRARVGKTTLTGLQHIGFILQSGVEEPGRGGFVRIYSGGEWIGEHFPWPPNELRASHENYNLDPQANSLEGTLLHFCVEPPPSVIVDRQALYPSFFHVPSANDLSNVRRTLAHEARGLFVPAHDFIDLFIDTDIGVDLPGRGQSVENWARRLRYETIIIRPSRTIRKSDFIDQILAISRCSVRPVKRLIYADVPDGFAIDLGNLLKEERLRALWPHSDLVIFILSQDWCCAAFKMNSDRQSFHADLNVAQAFIESADHRVIHAAMVAAVLRERDSELFWKDIDSDAYVNEPIVWTSATIQAREVEQVINGYLDLPLALAKRSCYRTARRSLRRAITSFAKYTVITSDILIRPVIYNNFIVYDGDRATNSETPIDAVLVGSVRMTGNTTARHTMRPDVNVLGIAHLLSHAETVKRAPTDKEGTEVTALLWIPSAPDLPTQPRRRYERISNTSFVVRGGERAVPLPRFAPPNPQDEEYSHSYYGDTPNAAYSLWQRRNVLKMGHWAFGLRHDFISINLLDVLQFDHADGGRVLSWFTGQLRTIEKEAKERNIPWIIVYPRYVASDLLIRMLRERMGESFPRSFPLQVVRDSSISPILFSPVEQERIWQYLLKFFDMGGIVVHVDDTVITSRVTRGIRDLVDGLWAQQIAARRADVAAKLDFRTVVLLDRTGLPTQRTLVEQTVARNPRLWRWDVPTLGSESSCPLCAILERCRDLRTSLNNKLGERVKQWLATWSPTSTSDIRTDRGLKPKPFSHPDSTWFCIEQSADDHPPLAHTVHHLISTSRAAIAVEICRSTTRKDYPLAKAKNGHFSDGAPFDLQTRIEILAAHVLLFLQELTFVDRIDRLTAMVDLLWSSSVATQPTMLAALTTLAEPKAAEILWEHCCKIIEEKGIPNDDALIVAFALHTLSNRDLPSSQSHPDWTLFRMLIIPIEYTRGCLCRVFQVFGWDADTFHQGLLLDLLTKESVEPNDLDQIVLMLEELTLALSKLRPEILALTDLNPIGDAQRILRSVQSIRDLARESIGPEGLVFSATTALTLLARHCEEDVSFNERLTRLLSSIYSTLFEGSRSLQSTYRTALTVKLKENTQPRTALAYALAHLARQWGASVGKRESEEVTRRWDGGMIRPRIEFIRGTWRKKDTYVYVDALVHKSLVESLSNVMHRSHRIHCPWENYSRPIEEADMWVCASIAEGGEKMIVELANGAVFVGDTQNPDQTRASIHLHNIGGRIRYDYDNGRQIFFTRIEIPTISSLALEQAQ
jgi:hypothetical protein